MTNPTQTTLRAFVIAVLDDQHGISSEALEALYKLDLETGDGERGALSDIIECVEAADGRAYLPETHEVMA